MPATGEIRAQQGHTRAGAAWRGAVVLCAAAVAIPAAAWLGSKLVGYDTRLAMAAAVPAAFAVGLPTVLWLRARNGFIAAPLLGTLLAVLAGASLWHDHHSVFAGGRLHLDHSRMAVYDVSLLAAGSVVALVSIVCAAVSGHRRPRQPQG